MIGVEVALCTFNGSRWLETQLRSIVRQSVPVERLVVGDDGSSDDTLTRLDALARQVRMDVVRNERQLGAVANFERTLQRTTRGFVFLCDQDDRWRDDKVERMLRAAEAYPQALLIWSDARLVDADGAPTGRNLAQSLGVSAKERHAFERGHVLPMLLKRNVVTGATVLLRRELIELALPIPPGYWHDEWLALVAAAVGGIGFVDAPLIDYRIHSENQAGLRGIEPMTKLLAMTSARSGFAHERVRKLHALASRLDVLGGRVLAKNRNEVRESLRHWTARAGLSPHRWRRLGVVARELTSGRYRRLSSGLRSAIRDLVEPLP